MSAIDVALKAIEPLILLGLTTLVAMAAPPVYRWFRDNSDNAFVALLGRLIPAAVREVEQTAPKDEPGAAKYARAHQAVVSRLAPKRKRIEQITGASLEKFAQTEIESTVYGMQQAKEAAAKVRPTSTAGRPR